ncbi:hypothetical protein MSG28_009176 [Choristoneura fumiferana]|uniref:Uncharacterized protein n=1 Tax=Choristoneura fumiferana TaxID=7141 RepID=A0ACC0KX21_CHOFU|nr:hypothetical protein MSG28_009176 [Choristoneura fumiferana]
MCTTKSVASRWPKGEGGKVDMDNENRSVYLTVIIPQVENLRLDKSDAFAFSNDLPIVNLEPTLGQSSVTNSDQAKPDQVERLVRERRHTHSLRFRSRIGSDLIMFGRELTVTIPQVENLRLDKSDSFVFSNDLLPIVTLAPSLGETSDVTQNGIPNLPAPVNGVPGIPQPPNGIPNLPVPVNSVPGLPQLPNGIPNLPSSPAIPITTVVKHIQTRHASTLHSPNTDNRESLEENATSTQIHRDLNRAPHPQPGPTLQHPETTAATCRDTPTTDDYRDN